MKNEFLDIWTDGSCINNGTASASSGVGIFYSVGSDRNISTSLPAGKQTNNRAELCAILLALCTNSSDQNITIYTDSDYSIKCITLYAESWERSGWKTSAKKPVEWMRVISYIRKLILIRASRGGATRFKYIKGHSGNKGNDEADKLARVSAVTGKVLNVVLFLTYRCNVPFS